MDVTLIAKPGSESVLSELRSGVHALRAAGYRVHPRLTFDERDAVRFAYAAAKRDTDLVIAAGGDGTVNLVVNGLVRAGDGHALPRLAVIPLGTANDFARGLGIPLSIEEALHVALHGTPEAIDVAQINGRAFVNVSTGGFGPDITNASSRRAKDRFGKLAYLFTGLRKLARVEPVRARFTVDGRVLYEGPFFFFAVGNARQTGGGMPVTPNADYSDARLDVAIVMGEKRRDFFKLIPDIRAGRHTADEGVLYTQARDVEVQAHDPMAVNADGEAVPGDTFRFGLLNRRIQVMRGQNKTAPRPERS